MELAYNQSKYQVSVAVKNRWMPGNEIKTFQFVANKTKLLTLDVLQAEAKNAGIEGTVLGSVLVERGKPNKTTKPAKAVKTEK